MLGVAAVYGFCREAKLSRPVSCGGMLLLYLCPRFFAEGHYNSKDMVLLTLFLCTLWLGPVSYTHLDVYKRQESFCFQRICIPRL